MPRAVFVGMTTVDMVYEVDAVPRPNEKVVARKYEVSCGGPATNAAITCAFLGGDTALISAVGSHPLASIVHRELDRFNVGLTDLSPDALEPPPVSSILVSRDIGERAIVSAHATCAAIPAERFDASVLNDCSLLLVDGHQMGCAIVAAQQAQLRNIPVVLDGGSWKERTQDLLPHVTYAICSADFHPPGITGVHDTIEFVLDHGPSAVAITRGSRPIVWATREQRGELSVPQVTTVDTLGAGDIFHGAFCSYLMNSAGLCDALSRAAEVAAHSCQFFGTRLWMESWPKPGCPS